MLLSLCAGCAHNNVPAETPEPTAGPTEAVTEEEQTPSPSPTAEPTPTADPVIAEALRIAEQHGLTEEELYGEYDFFILFADTVDGNEGLGKYRELVYRIFPVVADNIDYIEKDYFITRLSWLSFSEAELDPGLAGQFVFVPNSIVISTDLGESDESQYPSIIFHELMHFVDFSASRDEIKMYLLDGELLTGSQFLALPLDDQIRAIIVYGSEPISEGCAELFTAKYFAGAIRAYFDSCYFVTGLEYIYGSEKLCELFFSRHSDALFAQLFIDAGYSEDEYQTAAASLNWLTSPNVYKPQDYMRAEDILIDLYEHELGDGWKTDKKFHYILKSLSDIAWSGYEDSEHADFLAGIAFNTWEQYYDFAAKLYAGLPIEPDPRYLPPAPTIIGGRFMLAAFAEWRDPDTRELIHGTVGVEYDFENEKPIGWEIIDMDAALDEYLS